MTPFGFHFFFINSKLRINNKESQFSIYGQHFSLGKCHVYAPKSDGHFHNTGTNSYGFITGITIPFSSIAIESSVNIRKKKDKYDVCHLSNSCFYHSPDETYQNHVSEAHAEGPWLGCNFIFIALVSNVAGTPHSPESPSSFLPQTKSSCNRAALAVCFAESVE